MRQCGLSACRAGCGARQGCWPAGPPTACGLCPGGAPAPNAHGRRRGGRKAALGQGKGTRACGCKGAWGRTYYFSTHGLLLDRLGAAAAAALVPPPLPANKASMLPGCALSGCVPRCPPTRPLAAARNLAYGFQHVCPSGAGVGMALALGEPGRQHPSCHYAGSAPGRRRWRLVQIGARLRESVFARAPCALLKVILLSVRCSCVGLPVNQRIGWGRWQWRRGGRLYWLDRATVLTLWPLIQLALSTVEIRSKMSFQGCAHSLAHSCDGSFRTRWGYHCCRATV